MSFMISGFKLCRLKTIFSMPSVIYNTRSNCRPLNVRSCLLFNSIPKPRNRLLHSNATCQQNTGHSGRQLIFDESFAVKQDTVLYRHDRARFNIFMNFFAVAQFVFWTLQSHFIYSTMRDTTNPPTEKGTKYPPEPKGEKEDGFLKSMMKWNLGKYKGFIAGGCFFIGVGTMSMVWLHNFRSVRYLVLMKGGQKLKFMTFFPFRRNQSFTVPVEYVSACESRSSAKVYLPLRVKNRSLHFTLDMAGEFTNPKLFDYAVGIKRNWLK